MGLKDHMPSNRLYRGDVTDFEDAMKAVRDQCDHEIQTCCRFAHPAHDKAEAENAIKLEESLNAMKAAADQCLVEYRARVQTVARMLYEEWARSSEDDVRMIGEAALSGDYSGLAI